MKPWPRAILHADMDAFYASVEQLDRPELRGRPVIVGGSPKARGVVAAASYEVRAYGVRSAMPTARALRLCPRAVLVAPRPDRYAEVSAAVFEVFHAVTPLVQSMSLDEAFLDVTGSQRLYGDPVAIAGNIRAAVREKTGLTCSVGVASCRFVAKMASDMDKPDGLTVIPENEMLDRIGVLPVNRIWGVGPVMNSRLAELGIRTIGDLRQWPEETLNRKLGSGGGDLRRLANGLDVSKVLPDGREKSVSHEITFAADSSDTGMLEATLRELADQVASRLRRHGLVGRTVFVKLRYHDFSLVTRRNTLPAPCALSEVIFTEGRKLLRGGTEAGRRPVRLIGVGMTGLSEAGGRQQNLFAGADGEKLERLERLERITDEIRDKLGDAAIGRASAVQRERME